MDWHEQITEYLTDAHSIEEQALQQLESAPDIAGDDAFADALREHRVETERQESRVRGLLEGRGEEPSGVKDAVMSVGGEGFVLFARSQVDTPGKLASHAYSYEALEWASYDLLARTAERGGEEEVARVAREIRDEERRMMERIEGLWDRTTEVSLREVPRDDLREQLRKYLADAHAIEAQALALLDSGPDLVDDPTLADLFEAHHAETESQQDRLEMRLDALDGSRSLLKDAAMAIGGMEWGMFFGGHPDTTGKLAAFGYAFEHLEIGGYEQLRRVARRVGDAETERTVEGILEEERRMAERLAGVFEEAVGTALAEKSAD